MICEKITSREKEIVGVIYAYMNNDIYGDSAIMKIQKILKPVFEELEGLQA